MKKAIVALAVVAGLGLIGWRIYAKIKQTPGDPDRRGPRGSVAVAVEITPVRQDTVKEIGKFTGSLDPRSLYVVAPKIAGRLEKITVNVGDSVKPGQLIAELDDDEYAQQVEQAKAELAVAEASVAECKSALETAERELARVKTLNEKKVASESELDETEARYSASGAKHKVALAEVTRREAALKAAEVRLSYTRIHAAWENPDETRVVGERYVDEGEMLTANTPIVSILDNSVMTALIDIIERDYTKLKLGQPVVMTTDAFPGCTFTGTVVRISPLLKELSRQARVEIEISNTDELLKPGMFVRAEIEFDRHDNATVVPAAALASRDGRQGVFVADAQQMKARFVRVTAGIAEGEKIEVIDPALSGSVITMGHHLLEDGAAITLPEAPSSSDRRTGDEPRPDRTGSGGRQQ